MSQPLAHCPVHGIYPSYAFGISNASDVSFVGVKETCPRCGRPSEIVNGTYDFHRDGTFSAVLRPTPAQAHRLLTIIEWAKTTVEAEPERADVVADRVEKAVRKEWAGIGPVLDALGSERGKTAATWLSILIALVTLLVTTQADKISPQDISTILEQVQEHEQPQISPDSRPDVVPLEDDTPSRHEHP